MEEIKSDMSQCKIWTGGKKVVILRAVVSRVLF